MKSKRYTCPNECKEDSDNLTTNWAQRKFKQIAEWNKEDNTGYERRIQ
jgi:hypothetical protein